MPESFKIQVLSNEGYEGQYIDELVLVTPELQGVQLDNIEIQRVDNILGGLDFLKFFIPDLQGSFTIETDMVI